MNNIVINVSKGIIKPNNDLIQYLVDIQDFFDKHNGDEPWFVLIKNNDLYYPYNLTQAIKSYACTKYGKDIEIIDSRNICLKILGKHTIPELVLAQYVESFYNIYHE